MHHRPETLLSLIRSQGRRYGTAVGATALGQFCLLGVPLAIQAAIDGGLADEGSNWLTDLTQRLTDADGAAPMFWVAAAVVVTLTAAGGALQFVRGRLSAAAAESVVRDLRRRVFTHLHRLPCRWHDDSDTGDLVQRCTSDVDTLRAFLSVQVVQTGESAVMLCILIPIMLALDVRMALVSLALLPVILVFALVFFRRIQPSFRAVDEAEARMTTVLQENLTGIRVVRAFARGEHEKSKFAERNAAHRDRLESMIRTLGTYWALSDLVCFLQLGMVLLCGARWAMDGTLSPGTWFAFLTYEAMVLWPLRQAGRVVAETGKGLVAVSRISEILASAPEGLHELEARGAAARAGELILHPRPRRLRGAIDVHNLHFAYDGGEPVLRGLSFAIGAGETVALLGPPGSGKSTLIALLLRLHDHQRGSIKLDEHPITSLDRSFVRGQIGVALQEPFLYSRTITDNLPLGRLAASDDELRGAARDACVDDAITGLEDGYETNVGERGVTLSGGQRQRVALARALLKDPPILILDDALSAVDAETEENILAALERRRGTRTTIMIAHRLSTLRMADRVLVLERGRLVQQGTHSELADVEGPYRRLWRVQGALDLELEQDLASADCGDRTGGAE